MSEKHTISVSKTATFHVQGNLETAQTFWFVLHGYGMLAEYFIKKFEPITNNKTVIIAPEALSKFYNKGFNGRVGASWMTKEDRENEISDYINYLNQLYKEFIPTDKAIKVNIVGFSQGGPTASRWIADNKVNINNFILWSSIFPEGINFKNFGKNFKSFLIYGNNDEFAEPKYFTQQRDLLKKHDLDFKMVEFDGDHNIPANVLVENAKKFDWS